MATPTRSRRKFLTYRVQNIPDGTSKEELKGYFYMEDRDDIKIKSLCPSVDTPEGQEGDYTATIFFRPHEDFERQPRIAIDTIDIDKTFIGFTPLHVPSREQGPIAADIIAVSGLAGHAYGSWSHSPEHMWLRDYLPRDAPNARILTYGYPASLQGNTSISTLQDYTATFVQSLIGMRDSGECESRPIIFIGHSLGCLIIKKALADIAIMGVNPSRLPVRTIVFLAAPHRGLNVTAMQTLVKGKASQALVDELSGGSRSLNEISARFAQIAGDIDILTCYETKPTKTAIEVDGVWQRAGEPTMMVKLDSAQLFFPRESLMSAETDHSQISKIKRGEGGIYSRVKSAIRQGLVSTARIIASVEANPESLVQRDVFSTKDIAPPYRFPTIPIVSKVTITPLESPTPNPVESAPEDRNEVEPIISEPTPVKHEAAPAIISKPTPVEHEAAPELALVGDGLDPDNDPRDCDTCDRNFLGQELLFSCAQCSDGCDDDDTFNICARCQADGKLCPNDKGDGSHPKLLKYILRGRRYQLVPGLEIIPSDLPIVRAIKSRNAKTLASLAKSANEEATQDALYLAIRLGFEDMVKVLLDATIIDLEVFDDEGWSPLMLAIEFFYPSIVRMLLDQGADVNGKEDEDTHSPLQVAATGKNEECIRILLEYKPIIDVEFDDMTPLAECCAQGHVGCAQLLLDAGADPNFNYKIPEASPLVNAVRKDNRNLIDLLLRRGADFDAEDSKKQTPLIWAAREGCAIASDLLIDAGARVNTPDSSMKTALMYACENENLDIVTQLLTKTNASIFMRSKGRWSPLTYAASAGHIEIVKLLIKHGATGDPTPASKWKNFFFEPKVLPGTRAEILDIVRPLKHRSEGPQPHDPRLPKNWLRKVDKDRKSYFVDTETNTTHSELPK